MMFLSEFTLAGKVIKVEERTNQKGGTYTRVGVQTGTRGSDRAWVNMSNDWATGAEYGKQAILKVRFDATANKLRPTERPQFIEQDALALA